MTDDGDLSAPTRLGDEHNVDRFACGKGSLDDWLRRRARANEVAGASRTYVVCVGQDVVGYYCFANGGIDRDVAPASVRRNMPDPIPVMVVGRLAIDTRYQGRGIGGALLRDAIQRVLRAAEIAGIRALLVHAIDGDARSFYLRRGFLPFPSEPMTLCLTLETARRALPREH